MILNCHQTRCQYQDRYRYRTKATRTTPTRARAIRSAHPAISCRVGYFQHLQPATWTFAANPSHVGAREKFMAFKNLKPSVVRAKVISIKARGFLLPARRVRQPAVSPVSFNHSPVCCGWDTATATASPCRTVSSMRLKGGTGASGYRWAVYTNKTM
jgi:hypothetical protein